MTLDKAIQHAKVNRRPYRKSKSVDSRCRNHGSCGCCRGDRLHCRKIAEPIQAEECPY